MITKTVLSFFCFCSWIVFAQAQDKLEYSILGLSKGKLKFANEVVRTEQYRFTVESIKEGKLVHFKAVTFLNDKASENVLVHYDKSSKVSKFRAKLYDALGRVIRVIEKDEIEDIAMVDGFSIYNDDRAKHLAVTHHMYPYTLEFEYEVTRKGILFSVYPDWFIQDFHSYIQHAEFVMDVPAGVKFYHKNLNVDLTPKVIKADGREVYTWKVDSLAAVPQEVFSPSVYYSLPIILLSPDEFQIDDHKGSMRSWKDYGAFMHQLYKDKDVLPQDVAQMIDNFKALQLSEQIMVDTLYRFLQKNTRYVSVQLGIGGWEPFDAQYVGRNKYGDCKALTNFMKAMLGHAGITAYPALIHRGDLPYQVEESFTSPRFNHVVLYLPETQRWLECTSNEYPSNYLGTDNANRKALLVTEAGGELLATPAIDPRTNQSTRQASVVLREDGSSIIEESLLCRGYDYELLLYLQNNVQPEDQKKWFLRNKPFPTVEIQKMTFEPPGSKPEMVLSSTIQVGKFASKAGKRLFVPLNALNPAGSVPPVDTQRILPVQIKTGFSEVDNYIINIPAGYKVENLPSSVELHSPFGTYSIKVETQDNAIMVTRQYTQNEGIFPKQSFEEFRQFLLQVSKADAGKAVLVYSE